MAKSLQNAPIKAVNTLVIKKNPGEKLTQKDIDALNKASKENQPENVPPNSMDDLDLEVSDKINEFYKWLCEKNVTFYISALLPTSKEPKAIYRICKLESPEDQANYNKLMSRLGWNMYGWLEMAGILDWLARLGYITIHKSARDQNKKA